MSDIHLCIRLPELDGPTALQLIGILDAIVAELWLHYGDVMFRDAKGAVDPDPEPDDEDFSDLPF